MNKYRLCAVMHNGDVFPLTTWADDIDAHREIYTTISKVLETPDARVVDIDGMGLIVVSSIEYIYFEEIGNCLKLGLPQPDFRGVKNE